MNKRLLNPRPVSSVPVEEGYPLSNQQIDEIARVMFSRFYQEDGGPDYKNLFSEQIRNNLIKLIKQTIDCMVIKDYLIMPQPVN